MPTAVNPTGLQFIDGLLWGYKWDFTNLLYSFPTTPNDYVYAQGIFEFEAMNATQISSLTKAIQMYDEVCGITLTLTNQLGAGNIRFGEATSLNYVNPVPFDPNWHFPGQGQTAPGTAEGNPPDPVLVPVNAQGDVWFNHEFYNAPPIGSFFYAGGLIHEIGHTLGLKHGHQIGDAHGVTFPTLPFEFDSQEYSIMTYSAFVGGGPNSGARDADYPSTIMMLDILALQYMYGADYATRSGNTTYKWSPATGEAFIDGVGQGATFHGKILETIWDGGGKDTFDFSNYKTNVVCDLQPSGWSTPSSAQLANLGGSSNPHFARGSIATALLFNGDPASLIENATGGSGNDKLFGNFGANTLRGNAGKDQLKGMEGADKLFGGAGKDQFLFGALDHSTVKASGRDMIMDFSHGDKINLKAIDANFHTGGNQAFTFHANFTHHAGEAQFDQLSGNSFRVTLDVNGDAKADAAFTVKGVSQLFASDFIL